jgi:hypothetical protein
MSLRVEIRQGIAAEWPSLASDGPLLTSPGWLGAMTGRLGDRVLTIVVSEDGEAALAAFATVQAVPRPLEFFDLHHVLISADPALPLTGEARAGRTALAATAPGPGRWTPNLLVMLPGYECVPVGPGRDEPRLLDALVVGAVRWAAEQDLRAVAFLYTRQDAAGLAGALTGHDFVALPVSLTWDLPVPADGLAGYLGALPRKRRQDARRELACLGAAGVELSSLDLTAALAEPVLATLTALRCQLLRKYRGEADERTEHRRLAALIRDVCAGQGLVVTAEADGSLIGFALFGSHGKAWQCLSLGYDYSDPRSRFGYFATAFYGAVPAAAAAGVSSIGYGQGAAQAKRSRGCVGTPLTGWLRSADPDLTAAVRDSAAVTALGPAAGRPES